MNKPHNKVDLTGHKFGKLTVIRESHRRFKSLFWFCQCDCRGTKLASSRYLKSMITTHCGCVSRKPNIENLRNKILNNKIIEPNGCWRWTKSYLMTGYGRTAIGRTKYGAHRVSAYVFKGIPLHSKKVIDHLCRNRWCVNPEHLEWVSQSVNVKRGIMGLKKEQRKAFRLKEQGGGSK